MQNERHSVVGALWIGVAVFLLGFLAGQTFTKNYYQRSAVLLGKAEWAVDASGKTNFKWKP